MAEFLIYDKIHWMDDLSPADIVLYSQKYPGFKGKYEARYQKGDIVEVREDGYWDKRGFNKNAFCVIRVQGLRNAFYLADAYEGDEREIIKRRKYNIPLSNIVLNSEKKVEITEAQMTNFLVNKAEVLVSQR